MSEPISGTAAGVAGWKIIGGLAGMGAIGGGLATFVVMSMTKPKSDQEWRVALICTLVGSIGGGAALVRYLGIQHWVQDPFGMVAMLAVVFTCGLPAWGAGTCAVQIPREAQGRRPGRDRPRCKGADLMPPTSFIAMLAKAAQECQRVTGIPASFTLAQAALESSWGARAPGNNLFGVKADRSWKGKTVDVPTHEVIRGKRVAIVDTFRAYESWAECMADHARFFKVNPRYAACFRETTGEGWARAAAAAGYATDPDYAQKLIAVMRGRNMAQYDVLPRAAA